MSKKTVTVFGSTGTAGVACVNEFIRQGLVNINVLARRSGQVERSSSGISKSEAQKQQQYAEWARQGVTIKEVDVTIAETLVPALRGTDYLVSCVPLYATESQMPLIFAAKEAGVERFVPSEYGAIYEFEQFWQTDTTHRLMARQKAFIRRMIELAGMDYTIIPAGAWIEYYMLEPVMVMGDPDARLAWSTGADVGRIIPHVLAHPASRNAICPVAATVWCSWNELLAAREQAVGRPIERNELTPEQWRAAYSASRPGAIQTLLAIGVAMVDTPAGMSLCGHWNKTFLPEFKGTPLQELFVDTVEPFVEATRATLITAGELPADA
ncbi:NmrA-like family protein [compost metagenome]